MAGPAFILATDLRPTDAAWARTEAMAAAVQEFAERILGTASQVGLANLPSRSLEEPGEFRVGQVIERFIGDDASVLFVLPIVFGLNLWQQAMLGEELTAARHRHPGVSIHHDNVDPAHSLVVDCFADQILQALGERQLAPQQAGLLLVADGQGDPATRADSYRLMRLLWERADLKLADTGFVRHAQPFLRETLGRCGREPLHWLLLPQCQWDGELCDYTRVLLSDHQRENPAALGWPLLDPPGEHPAILAWIEQRLLRLWQQKRASQAVRVPSARYQPNSSPAAVWSGRDWVPMQDAVSSPRRACVARARDSNSLAAILERVLPRSERYLVKVTWHGYAQGTYTGPAALDLLLSALPGRAVLLEGHTSSRNVADAESDMDWETDAARHRTWIRQQDLEFLRRTGLAEVIARHGAHYLNVTEAWWDGACAPAEHVRAALGDLALQNPELADFLPSALTELRGTPFISFARFKGPTRLSISNLFGLIPHPLRTAWHGPDIAHFASVCCDLAQLYGSFFPLFGFVEAFDSAVRWDRKGLYRSRWGNYDLVLTDGLFTLSEGLVGADLLASRLQGQDVRRSGFYDVVRGRLGESQAEEELPLPADLQTSLV
jgi:sirohydrochlorin ferrochelatase